MDAGAGGSEGRVTIVQPLKEGIRIFVWVKAARSAHDLSTRLGVGITAFRIIPLLNHTQEAPRADLPNDFAE